MGRRQPVFNEMILNELPNIFQIYAIYMQVSFRKRATDCRALLQKPTYKDKASYESWPTCTEYNDIQWVTNSVLDLHNIYVCLFSHKSHWL